MVEFIELYVILANVPVFGGLNLPQAALVFALANAGFALADVGLWPAGHDADLPTPRSPGGDARPADAAHAAADHVRLPAAPAGPGRDQRGDHLCRAAGAASGLHAGTIYLLVITPFVGAAIYAAFFATAGGLQFFLIDGAEFTVGIRLRRQLRGPAARQRLDHTDSGARSPLSFRPPSLRTCRRC